MSARNHRLDHRLEVPMSTRTASTGPEFLPHLRSVRSGSDGKVVEAPAALESIVVATDFSEYAAHAVSRVGMLGDVAGLSKVVLLHVIEAPRLLSLKRSAAAPAGRHSWKNATAGRQVAGLADELRRRAAFTVEGHVEVGHVVPTIQCVAAAADLLVLGAQGAHPIRDLFVGSTAQRVLRNTSRPVLVVRRKAARPYRQVLVAVDFQSDPKNALSYAQALAPGAKLNVVHAYEVPFEGKMRYASVSDDVIDFYREEARGGAARAMSELISSRAPSVAVEPLIVRGNAVRRLVDKERELAADLIVVTRRNRSLTGELLFQSVTSGLLEASQCDVLVVR